MVCFEKWRRLILIVLKLVSVSSHFLTYTREPPDFYPVHLYSPPNVFDVSQVLAWLAKERRDLHEQLEWREQIPKLLAPLMS